MEHINCVICETDNSQHIMSGRDYRYGTTDEVSTFYRRIAALLARVPVVISLVLGNYRTNKRSEKKS